MITANFIACAIVGLVHGLWALEAHIGDQDSTETPHRGTQE